MGQGLVRPSSLHLASIQALWITRSVTCSGTQKRHEVFMFLPQACTNDLSAKSSFPSPDLSISLLAKRAGFLAAENCR